MAAATNRVPQTLPSDHGPVPASSPPIQTTRPPSILGSPDSHRGKHRIVIADRAYTAQPSGPGRYFQPSIGCSPVRVM